MEERGEGIEVNQHCKPVQLSGRVPAEHVQGGVQSKLEFLGSLSQAS